MDQNLQRLVRELRKETCPQKVMDEVTRRISAKASLSSRFRFALAAGVAGLVLLCGVLIWRGSGSVAGHRKMRSPEFATAVPAVEAGVADQAQVALGYIGRILLDAGSHSERVILNEAVPPLRNSLEIARNKTINRI